MSFPVMDARTTGDSVNACKYWENLAAIDLVTKLVDDQARRNCPAEECISRCSRESAQKKAAVRRAVLTAAGRVAAESGPTSTAVLFLVRMRYKFQTCSSKKL